MRTVCYLIGPPGAGKTTALRNATAAYDRRADTAEGCPVVRLTYRPGGQPHLGVGEMTELGRDREGSFAGTDALSMSIQPRALVAMAAMEGLVVAEGDRLGNERFWTALEQDIGWRVRAAYLNTSAAEAARRREGRGGGQDPKWVKGRVTKSRRLAERWGATTIDGDGTPGDVARQLAEFIAGAARGD